MTDLMADKFSKYISVMERTLDSHKNDTMKVMMEQLDLLNRDIGRDGAMGSTLGSSIRTLAQAKNNTAWDDVPLMQFDDLDDDFDALPPNELMALPPASPRAKTPAGKERELVLHTADTDDLLNGLGAPIGHRLSQDTMLPTQTLQTEMLPDPCRGAVRSVESEALPTTWEGSSPNDSGDPSAKPPTRPPMKRWSVMSLQTDSESPGDVRKSIREDTAKKGRRCFADANDMKAQVRQALHVKAYKTTDCYHTTGVCQSLARSEIFENMTLFVIFCNAIWISIDTDKNDADLILHAEPTFQVMEGAFFVYFGTEWFIRWCAFANKTDSFKDAWFCFDSILVGLMFLENCVFTILFAASGNMGSSSETGSAGNASILRLFRLMRLSRMTRLAKFLRLMPEIMIIIKGMAIASRSVMFTFVLLMAIIYVYAVAFVILSDEDSAGASYFSSVPAAMASLLLHGTFPDHAGVVYDVGEQGIIFAILYMSFILLASITLMNMLVGILVEVVSVTAMIEKEQMNTSHVAHELYNLLEVAGIEEWEAEEGMKADQVRSLLTTPGAARAINDVGVDVIYLVDFCDFIFTSQKTLSFGNFVEIVMQLRGQNPSTVKDVADLRKLIVQDLFSKLAKMDAGISLAFKALESRTDKLAEIQDEMHEDREKMLQAAEPNSPKNQFTGQRSAQEIPGQRAPSLQQLPGQISAPFNSTRIPDAGLPPSRAAKGRSDSKA
jgi:hypothetical protein